MVWVRMEGRRSILVRRVGGWEVTVAGRVRGSVGQGGKGMSRTVISIG